MSNAGKFSRASKVRKIARAFNKLIVLTVLNVKTNYDVAKAAFLQNN